MLRGLRQKVIVQPGGVIEIRSPQLVAGVLAEVIVLLELPTTEPKISLLNIIGTGRGGFSKPEDVDAFMRQEREAWTF